MTEDTKGNGAFKEGIETNGGKNDFSIQPDMDEMAKAILEFFKEKNLHVIDWNLSEVDFNKTHFDRGTEIRAAMEMADFIRRTAAMVLQEENAKEGKRLLTGIQGMRKRAGY